MSHLLHGLALVFAIVASVVLGRGAGLLPGVGGRPFPERFVSGFTVVVGWWTLGAYALGSLHWLAAPWAWFGWLGAGGSIVLFLWRRICRRHLAAARARGTDSSIGDSVVPGDCGTFRQILRSRWRRLLLGKPHLGLAVFLLAWVALANLVLLFAMAPNSFDAMLYHLARVAYFLQQGDFSAYGANQFSQEQLARGSAALLCGLYALGGRSDIVAGWPQFLAWWAGGAAVFALARTWRASPSASAFAGACWMLLSVAWLEAPTAQNDVLIAAHIASSLLHLRRYRLEGRTADLLLAGAAFGLAVGTKASALTLLPALALANGPALWRPRVVALAALAALPFVAPSGYLENARRHGHALGAEALTEHVAIDRPLTARLMLGARNALRFAFDACTLDLVPPLEAPARALASAKARVAAVLADTPFDLELASEVRMPFWRERLHRPDENLSYFGPFGLFLAAAVCVACLAPAWRWHAAALLSFLALQCLAGPYDLIRGRQFLYGAALALPALAWWSSRWSPRLRAAAACLVALSALHVLPAALLRNNALFLTLDERAPFWRLDRLDQMTSLHASHAAQRAFDARVPRDARVGVGLQGYEYPLFGYKHGRRLVPVRALAASGRPLPSGLDWLLFTPGPPPLEVQPGDEDLGCGWWLRRLGAGRAK